MYLTGFAHLSLSFDGWSSKGHDEIYTVHITTPLRRSFLIEGLILNGLSATSETLFGLLSTVSHLLVSSKPILNPKKIILHFAPTLFSIIISDTTANVKKCRRLICECEKWPWILNCPDPCHGLQLMMKDVVLGSKTHPKI